MTGLIGHQEEEEEVKLGVIYLSHFSGEFGAMARAAGGLLGS